MLTNHDFGFRWGPLDITRLTADTPYPGQVVLQLETEQAMVNVIVTKSGKLRIVTAKTGAEWQAAL